MPDIQDPTKIRNIATALSLMRHPYQGFSSRRQNGIHFGGLLFLVGGIA